jgi:5'/3'-nucleotidase
MRTHTRLLLAMVTFSVVPLTAGAATQTTLNVMVTNDDGVAADGIDALVEALRANPNLNVTVIAPATNQSGKGDAFTTTSDLTSAAVTTKSGFTATAVGGSATGGTPADTVLFGFKQGLPAPPNLVVSGINFGQNIAEAVPISGTVGAALWAARLGVPAFAFSAGLVTSGTGSPNFADAAKYAARLVEEFRKKKPFQKKMVEKDPPHYGMVLNINFPTCASGSVRGVKVVPIGRITNVTGYTLASESGGVQTWTPSVQTGDLLASDCNSTLATPTTDLEGMNNGFATVTPLSADLTVSGLKLKDYTFVEKLWPVK